jgi:CheY-like chemotaxis protein
MNKMLVRILVIDDEQSLREMVAFVLRSKGVEVLEAESGERGIALAQTTCPNLIICDISMGETDGFGVFNQLQQQPQTARIPFIFMSALTRLIQAPLEIKESVTFMEKPFGMDTLLKVVSSKLQDQMGDLVCLADQRRSTRLLQKPLATSPNRANLSEEKSGTTATTEDTGKTA